MSVEIHVETKRPNRFLSLLMQAVFWLMLVSSIAISRIWLGGSFLVELLAAIFSIVVLVHLARGYSGAEIRMSVHEVDAWIRDGAPVDVKEWLAARSAKPVRSRP
ncbi:hypothetical protein [Bradyrhizobium erythrophlei]|uniref:Uncharacterized protein n=1 Tax=Bradyrhizobium erythrophlei TaxID=1437360 RepID=A0A1H4NM26_9BRAD|nr:hypothetical protein [Bradyrhizobium erythrophlei]SEB95898.1 hypothetical protein SAMN05444164_0661 [Bradyrhizobium erythrophlei]